MAERRPDEARLRVGRLYDSHAASLYRYAAILLGDAAAAEDAIQQVFSSLLRRPVLLDDETHYLRRAVRNECYSMLRRRRDVQPDGPLLEPIAGDGVAPDERIALERALRALPPEQREVVHLHVYEGLTFQEVAASQGVSINTAAARYRYALARLRHMFSHTARP